MTCSYCGTRNGEGDHRCRRCGRRPGDTLTGEFNLARTTGALAAKLVHLEHAPRGNVAELPKASRPIARAVQGSLFQERPASNVVAFESYAQPRPAVKPDPRPAKAKSNSNSKRRVAEGQGSLDFLPPLPAKTRTLGTTVEAVIYCEAPVAMTLHRAVAAAIDWSMVLLAYGLFLLTFRLCGGAFILSRNNVMILGGVLPLLGFVYGLMWTIAGAETAGMHFTHLRLTTFDGYRPEAKHRLLRFLGSCLSTCTLLGLLWSLADEESLTWQDHISRTFPTPSELDSQVFRRV